MLKDTILSKYWNKEELKGLSLKRALAIIQVLEMWEGILNDDKRELCCSFYQGSFKVQIKLIV